MGWSVSDTQDRGTAGGANGSALAGYSSGSDAKDESGREVRSIIEITVKYVMLYLYQGVP